MNSDRLATVALTILLLLHLILVGCRVPVPEVKKTPTGPQYVRLVQIDGRWWFARGEDRFIALGVNVVVPEDQTKSKDGRHYNVLPKYQDNREAWAKDALARLHTWGFNTVAAWSDPILYDRFPVYHTRVVWMGPWGQHDSRLIDVFSPNYSNELKRTAEREIAPHATNEYLIGYFLNNELPWYGEKGWPTGSDVSLLTRYFRLAPAAPGKKRLIEFLQKQYGGDFSAFERNWAVENAADFHELVDVRKIRPLRREAQKDVIAWAGVVAEQYFSLVSSLMRQYDPNHLFLGVRFAGSAYEPVLAACARYAHVISINHYRKSGHVDTDYLGAIATAYGKPVMITEFSWRAQENSSGCPNTIGADVTVETQADRAARYRTYVEEALQQPYLVGLDWFMYHDQPPGGRFDGENSNYGLVDIHDNVYDELVNAISEINGRAAELHAKSEVPFPPADLSRLIDYRDIRLAADEKKLDARVLFADKTCEFIVWGDTENGSRLDASRTEKGFIVNFVPGSGWGAGITLKPLNHLAVHPDGSADLSGAKRILIRLNATPGIYFAAGVQESGHGPIEAQTFDGYAGADGESYVHNEAVTLDGERTYEFELLNMQPSYGYGNQRGNCRIDTPAIAQCYLFFPGRQKTFALTILSIEFD